MIFKFIVNLILEHFKKLFMKSDTEIDLNFESHFCLSSKEENISLEKKFY
jgi:hypothetical protein